MMISRKNFIDDDAWRQALAKMRGFAKHGHPRFSLREIRPEIFKLECRNLLHFMAEIQGLCG